MALTLEDSSVAGAEAFWSAAEGVVSFLVSVGGKVGAGVVVVVGALSVVSVGAARATETKPRQRIKVKVDDEVIVLDRRI